MPPTLSDLIGSSAEITFEGITYKVRPPDQIAQGMFTTWLARRDRENAVRASDVDDATQEKLLRFSGINFAAGLYDWGSDAYVTALQTPVGVAKMLYFVLRNENPALPISEELVMRLVGHKIAEIAILLQAEAETDPAVKKNLLRSVGLPPDSLNKKPKSSSSSPTRRSTSRRKR
ncbi:MAG: hypothetical protein JWO38_7121 [Gemmataceae bacterium]|nr:hypothetical protein [Gemmataceae bacterium]